MLTKLAWIEKWENVLFSFPPCPLSHSHVLSHSQEVIGTCEVCLLMSRVGGALVS